MTDPEPRQIDWSSAEFEDRTLMVGLSGSSSKQWNSRFTSVLGRLPQQGDWGAVSLKKKRIEVSDVGQGTESDLRHFLESIVLQANTDVEPDDDAGDGPNADDGRSDLEERVTATFRSFASD